ncbi:hypothetical protein FHS54_002950 [Sphingobium vermicomposti]|uniref:Uncharacterized protein n=1 Tax=Sphingobium vermicomposti TaxID=529005 RepID=A0A846MBE2_9SPHN|nr:hypothetical protein [Sphingobium vermicomposti]
MAPVSGGEPDTGAWDEADVRTRHAERRLLSEADIERLPSRHWRKAERGSFAD